MFAPNATMSTDFYYICMLYLRIQLTFVTNLADNAWNLHLNKPELYPHSDHLWVKWADHNSLELDPQRDHLYLISKNSVY